MNSSAQKDDEFQTWLIANRPHLPRFLLRTREVTLILFALCVMFARDNLVALGFAAACGAVTSVVTGLWMNRKILGREPQGMEKAVAYTVVIATAIGMSVVFWRIWTLAGGGSGSLALEPLLNVLWMIAGFALVFWVGICLGFIMFGRR